MDTSFQLAAEWYDGRSALRHAGELHWDGHAGLVLHAPTARAEFAVDDLQFAQRDSYDVKANWKVMIDNFLCF